MGILEDMDRAIRDAEALGPVLVELWMGPEAASKLQAADHDLAAQELNPAALPLSLALVPRLYIDDTLKGSDYVTVWSDDDVRAHGGKSALVVAFMLCARWPNLRLVEVSAANVGSQKCKWCRQVAEGGPKTGPSIIDDNGVAWGVSVRKIGLHWGHTWDDGHWPCEAEALLPDVQKLVAP